MLKKENQQLDEGFYDAPCRKAEDICEAIGIPTEILASLERHKIGLVDAVFFARTRRNDQLHMQKRSRECFEKFLKAENFFRDDFTVSNFGYVRLMRETGMKPEYVGSLLEIKSNEEYETCKVVSARDKELMDLKLDNRLSARGQKILRGLYGLDGEVYTIHEIAESFNYVDEELAKKYPKAAQLRAWSNSRDDRVRINSEKSMAKLVEERDDKREYLQKLVDKLDKALKDNEIDPKLIESYAGDIIRISKI